MKKDEYDRMKSYFLNQAKKCEKRGFSFAALELYKSFQPTKAKGMLISIGKKAEKAGLFSLAAEAYQTAGIIQKSRILYRKVGLEMQKNNLPTLAAEMFEKSKTERHDSARKFFVTARTFEREGKFKEAQKEWIKAAKYREKEKNFAAAVALYFNGGDIRNAKRVWNKAHKYI